MLVLQLGGPCLLALRRQRGQLRGRHTSVWHIKAVQQDDQFQKKSQDVQKLPSGFDWDEHINIQSKQADSYRPPVYQSQDMQASREKFLGRLAVLILGVSVPVAYQQDYHTPPNQDASESDYCAGCTA